MGVKTNFSLADISLNQLNSDPYWIRVYLSCLLSFTESVTTWNLFFFCLTTTTTKMQDTSKCNIAEINHYIQTSLQKTLWHDYFWSNENENVKKFKHHIMVIHTSLVFPQFLSRLPFSIFILSHKLFFNFILFYQVYIHFSLHIFSL